MAAEFQGFAFLIPFSGRNNHTLQTSGLGTRVRHGFSGNQSILSHQGSIKLNEVVGGLLLPHYGSDPRGHIKSRTRQTGRYVYLPTKFLEKRGLEINIFSGKYISCLEHVLLEHFKPAS